MKLSVTSKEFGRGKGSREMFATLAEAAKYIKDRWQGADYSDGAAAFHTDYCTYELRGFTLADIGRFTYEDGCREFTFNTETWPPLPRASEYDAATHRAECADMSNRGTDANGFDLRAPFPHASDPHWSDPRADFASY